MSESNRKKFIEKLKQQIDDIDNKMDAIEKKAGQLKDETRGEYEERISALRAARTKAQQQMENVRDAGEDRWEDVKDEAEHTWKALQNSFNYFKSHFK